MTTLVARFPDLNLVAIPDEANGGDLSFSKVNNKSLTCELVLGEIYNVVYDGEMRRMLYQRSSLNGMFLFDV